MDETALYYINSDDNFFGGRGGGGGLLSVTLEKVSLWKVRTLSLVIVGVVCRHWLSFLKYSNKYPIDQL